MCVVSENMELSISHILQSFLIMLPVTACSLITFWLVLVQLRYRRRERSWLIAWSITATVLYACHAVYFADPELPNPVVDTIYVTCNLAVYPLYLLYLIALTGRRCPRPFAVTLLLAPALCGSIVTGVLYGMMDAGQLKLFTLSFMQDDSMDSLNGMALLQAWWHVACRVVFAIQVVGVVFTGQHLIRHYNEEIAMDYADVQGRSLSSVHIILWLLLATALLSAVANAIGRHWFATSPWFLILPSFAFSILLTLIGWEGILFGLVPIDTYRPPLQETLSAERVEACGDAAPNDEQEAATEMLTEQNLSECLVQVLREQKLFLRHDLRLTDLTEIMNTNRTYLWKALKSEGTTFSDIVNKMRIEYAIEMMSKYPDMSLIDICVRSGYANMDSFYRHFRNVMHCTPREYICFTLVRR